MISRSHSHSPDRSQCNCNLDLSCSVELVTRAASQSQAAPTLLPHACPHDPVISMEEWWPASLSPLSPCRKRGKPTPGLSRFQRSTFSQWQFSFDRVHQRSEADCVVGAHACPVAFGSSPSIVCIYSYACVCRCSLPAVPVSRDFSSRILHAYSSSSCTHNAVPCRF